MIPSKYNKTDTKTGKTYEHNFTEEEQAEIDDRLKKGEKMSDILKSFRERFTDDDWIEV